MIAKNDTKNRVSTAFFHFVLNEYSCENKQNTNRETCAMTQYQHGYQFEHQERYWLFSWNLFLSVMSIILFLCSTVQCVTDGSGSNIGVRNDGKLYLYDKEYKFVEWDAYCIATMYGINPGCGCEFTDIELDIMFSILPPNSLVRFGTFQESAAVNVYTNQLD
jgi:hypothetical protein